MTKPLTRQQAKPGAEWDAEVFAWLLRLPAVKAQAYFWNYSSRMERKQAMRRDYAATLTRSAR